MPRRARRKPFSLEWRLLTVWMCSSPRTRSPADWLRTSWLMPRAAAQAGEPGPPSGTRRATGPATGFGAASGDQQSIGADDRLEGRREGGCGNRRQHGAEGCARAVGRPQHRHQFVRQSSLGGLAAALAGFSIRRIGIRSALLGPLPGPIALAAPQDEGLIGLDDAEQP